MTHLHSARNSSAGAAESFKVYHSKPASKPVRNLLIAGSGDAAAEKQIPPLDRNDKAFPKLSDDALSLEVVSLNDF